MLSVTGITAGYYDTMILQEVNLEVPDGAIVCVMGRNGVGKTTLMKTIMGIIPPKSGDIIWDDQVINLRSSHIRVQNGIGYVPQGRDIFPYLSVRENLYVGAGSRQRSRREIERVLDIFPALRDILKRPGGVLSGGQQQQLAMARALLRQPRLLILDEPTEGIQPSIVTKLHNTIIDINRKQGVSILLVEQYMDFAMQAADYIYVLESGRVATSGDREEMTSGILRQYLAV